MTPTVSGDSSRDSASAANAAATMRYEVDLVDGARSASGLEHAAESEARASAPRRTTRIGSAAPSAAAGKGTSGVDRRQERERAQQARQLRRPLQPRRHGVAARDHAHRVAALEVVGGERRGERDRALEAVLGQLVGARLAVGQRVVEEDASRGARPRPRTRAPAGGRCAPSSASGCRADRRRRGTRAGRGTRRAGPCAPCASSPSDARARRRRAAERRSAGRRSPRAALDAARLAEQRERELGRDAEAGEGVAPAAREACGDTRCAAGGRRGS